MDKSDIEQLALDADIESAEGLSTDQMTRSRIAFLAAQSQTILQMTQMADAKAGAILALMGLAGVHLAQGGITAPLVVLFILLAMKAAVILLCIAVLIPRLTLPVRRSDLAANNRFAWLALTGESYGADAHAEFMQTSQASQLVVSMARSNVATSLILLRKFSLLRIAFIIAGLDVALMLGSLFLLGLTGEAS